MVIVKEIFVLYHFNPDDRTAEKVIRLLLNEDKRRVDFGQGRTIIFHRATVPNTFDHLHFQVKGTNIAAINRDGTAHDRSHGIKLQRWALDGMANHYPGFKPPKDGIIESLMAAPLSPGSQVLNENECFIEGATMIPRAVLILAVEAASKAYKAVS